MGKVAFLFPGQGSAAVGMGISIAARSRAAGAVLTRLAALRPVVDELRASGPADALIRTSNAQPAIFAVDCACLAALDELGIRPDLVAGHSLGEYAALVASGVVSFEDGLSLVVERGRMMERAARARPGTMRAILGLSGDQVEDIVGRWRGRGVIANANDNAPGQVVISGDIDTLEAAASDFAAAGGRVMALPVGGAFHSELMRDAQDAFLEILNTTPFADPRVPLISNQTARAATTAEAVKAALRGQITSSVRWRESVEAMLEADTDTFVEVGPGKVLSGLVQRCAKARGLAVRVLNVEDVASLDRTIAALDDAAQAR